MQAGSDLSGGLGRPRKMFGLSLLFEDDIDRNLNRLDCPSVFEPVCSIPILWPTHSWPIVCSDTISMIGDRTLQDVYGAWSTDMVVNWAEDASRLDCHCTHSKLAPCHALDLRPEINR